MESEHTKKAEELFISGCGCAQAVLAAFSDVTGLDEATSLRIASSFGGGMGRMREVCGTCSAMFMVAGLLYGGYDPMDVKAKSAHYALVQELASRFKEVHKTINCRELLGGLAADSSPNATPRDQRFYKVRPCVKFVKTAAEILDQIINDRDKEA